MEALMTRPVGYVTSSDLQKKVKQCLDAAWTKDLIVMTHKRRRAVLISHAEWIRLRERTDRIARRAIEGERRRTS